MDERTTLIFIVTLALVIATLSSSLPLLGNTNPLQAAVGTEIEPTDKDLKCYMQRYPTLARSGITTIEGARTNWFTLGWRLGRLPHCPRDKTSTPPALSDEEAKRYGNAYVDLRRFAGDVTKLKNHWQQHGWHQGRVVPPPSMDLWKRMVSFLGADKSMYCGVNANGVVECNRGTVGSAETFNMEQVKDNAFLLKNAMTGKYCSDEGSRLQCDREPTDATTFTYQLAGQQKVAFVSEKSGKPLYCADDANNVVCNRNLAGPRAIFKWQEVSAPPAAAIANANAPSNQVPTSSTTTTTTITTTPAATVTTTTAAAEAEVSIFRRVLRRIWPSWFST